MTTNSVDKEALYDEGWRLLDAEEFGDSLEIGERLERLRWTGGFELQATVHERMGNLEKAVATLQRGVEVAGGPYLLFSRLGNYLSDLHRYEEALSAYDAGLQLESTDGTLFGLNRGIVFSRMGKSESALKELREVEPIVDADGDQHSIFWHLKAAIADELSSQCKYAELEKLIEPLVGGIFESDDFELEKARICEVQAKLLWQGAQITARDRWLDRAIFLDPCNEKAMWLTREILKETLAPGGVTYEIVVEGIWPASSHSTENEMGFFVGCSVIADNEFQGFQFIKRFIHPEIRDLLVVTDIEITEPKRDEPKGIYRFGGYQLFDSEAEEH